MIPTPGSLWRHYRGTEYRVVSIARHSETQEVLVTYRPKDAQNALEDWARPLSMWNEIVEPSFGVRRFTRVDS